MKILENILKVGKKADVRPIEDWVPHSSDVDSLIKTLSALPRAGVSLSCTDSLKSAELITDRIEILYGGFDKPEVKDRLRNELIKFLQEHTEVK